LDTFTPDLSAWIGREEIAHDVVTATPYAALSATLDRDPVRPPAGTPLPPLWHWLYFLPLHRQSTLGPDGHAERGGFLPPVPLPRRMWAASDIALHAPLRVGDALTRVSRIESIAEKRGRSGALVFVRPRSRVTHFAFRARSPLFDLHPFDVCGDPADDGTVRLWARDHAGALAMDATATIASP
jgi:hydroxyacyl-ACP dehydratase HTD2-like protein with hotdog domain